MSLRDQVQQDMLSAMKNKEEIKLGALRMLKAAIMKFEVSGEKKVATDDEVVALVNKEIKSRKDSAEQFKAGNRPELAKKEEKEIEVLNAYMPIQLSETEITTIAKEVIAGLGVSTKADMGKVMGAMMPKVKGKADGVLVNKVVMSLLS